MKKINEIIIEGTIYPRTRFDSDTVERYTEAMAAGAKFPPLVITPDGRLLDGRHRYEAYKQVGKAEAEVAIEDPVDPAVRAVELNLQHGKPLTRAEMRELARKWYGARPVTEIANILGVARQTVQNWVSDLAVEREEAREEIREKALEMRAKGKTQEEVAERLGVTQQAVSKWEYNSVKNLTPLYEKNSNNQPMEDESVNSGLNKRQKDGEENKEVAEQLEVDQATVSRWEYASVKNLTPAYWDQDEQLSTENKDLDHEEILEHDKEQPNCYLHNEREIFASKGLGSEYGTFWRSPTGGLHRVKTPAMPMVATQEEAQKNLDEWAEKKGLQPVCSGTENIVHEHTEITGNDHDEHKEVGSGSSACIDLPDYGGREAAEAFRKKHLECSDQVKEFFNQVKKASEIAEQLVNNREKLYRSIVEMEGDGISIAVLASATVQACDIYVPRMTAARDMLSELLEKKGVTSKDKFLVLNGGKQNGN